MSCTTWCLADRTWLTLITYCVWRGDCRQRHIKADLAVVDKLFFVHWKRLERAAKRYRTFLLSRPTHLYPSMHLRLQLAVLVAILSIVAAARPCYPVHYEAHCTADEKCLPRHDAVNRYECKALKPTLRHLGQTCDNNPTYVCDWTKKLWCQSVPNVSQKRCAYMARINESCSGNKVCMSPSLCTGGKCKIINIQEHGSCGEGRSCALNLKCVNGKCKTPDMVPANGVCTPETKCQSGYYCEGCSSDGKYRCKPAPQPPYAGWGGNCYPGAVRCGCGLTCRPPQGSGDSYTCLP